MGSERWQLSLIPPSPKGSSYFKCSALYPVNRAKRKALVIVTGDVFVLCTIPW